MSPSDVHGKVLGVSDPRADVMGLTDYVYQRTRSRLAGLTDDEYFWEPVSGCCTVRRTDSGAYRADSTDRPVAVLRPATGTGHCRGDHCRLGPCARFLAGPAPGVASSFLVGAAWTRRWAHTPRMTRPLSCSTSLTNRSITGPNAYLGLLLRCFWLIAQSRRTRQVTAPGDRGPIPVRQSLCVLTGAI
jgi:hypothetical protein